jgi:hypothetical protein
MITEQIGDDPPESYINDRRQDWLTELSPEDYERCMALLEELLGVPYRYSPEATAAHLLRHLHDRPGGKRLLPSSMPPPALEPSTEADLHWIRPLTTEERIAPYIVAYDVNAAYLAACSALPLGVGEPRQVRAHGRDTIPLGTGYFLWPRQYGWKTTPSAEYWQVLRHGAQLPAIEAWIWDETSRPLEPWYKVLRDARAALMLTPVGLVPLRQMPYGQAALQTIKMMYSGFLGRCASTKWGRSGDPLFRPDWRHMVIATRRTRLQRVMTQTYPAPFAAYSDCLYFATAHQVTGLKMGTNPGSFKLHGTQPHAGDVRAAAEDGQLARLVQLVKD